MDSVDPLRLGSKPAPGELALVQGFLNTLDVEGGTDALKDPAAVTAWFSRHGRLAAGERATEADQQRVVAVRTALRALLVATTHDPLPAAQMAVLEEASARSPLALTVNAKGRLALGTRGGDIDAQLAELLAIVHRAQLSGTWERLKLCAADTCRWAFYDASRNRSGTWCSMEVCGNREKVRTHRARHDG